MKDNIEDLVAEIRRLVSERAGAIVQATLDATYKEIDAIERDRENAQEEVIALATGVMTLVVKELSFTIFFTAGPGVAGEDLFETRMKDGLSKCIDKGRERALTEIRKVLRNR